MLKKNLFLNEVRKWSGGVVLVVVLVNVCTWGYVTYQQGVGWGHDLIGMLGWEKALGLLQIWQHSYLLFVLQLFQEALSSRPEQAAGALPSAYATTAPTLRLPTEEKGEETYPSNRPEDLKNWKRKYPKISVYTLQRLADYGDEDGDSFPHFLPFLSLTVCRHVEAEQLPFNDTEGNWCK